MESRNKKTIFISNLPTSVTEEDLRSIFENFGICVSCELNMETLSAYLEFDQESSAEKALAMDNVEMGSNQVRVVIAFQENAFMDEPATYTLSSEKIDYTKAVQIFVGDIGFDVDESMLKEGFSPFGKVLEVKIVRMPDGKHRGYAFISFSNETEAENAIQSMNNTMFHNRNIKCNWATKNKNANGSGQNRKSFQQQYAKTLDQISYETPQSNTSVYVTGENLMEDVLRSCFERFGKIKNIKAYPDKNHAFINYESHDSAANAIYHLNGYTINNFTMKCNWSKKNGGAGIGNDKRMVDNYYSNSNPYYDNNRANQFNNSMQQYDQYYQTNYQPAQFQQQYYNNSQVLDYYNNVQMQNYNQQYQQNFNSRPQKSNMNNQSYQYYAPYSNSSQQYNMYQQQ